MVSLVIAIVSLVVATVTFFLNFNKFKKELYSQALLSNENHIMEIESRIGNCAQLLRFHGIEDPDSFLDDLGIDSYEFAYLLNSFTAGSLFYNTAGSAKKDRILVPGSYRWVMCKSPAVKKAWPGIKLQLAHGEYRDRLEAIINED